jgi:hypothetical protein
MKIQLFIIGLIAVLCPPAKGQKIQNEQSDSIERIESAKTDHTGNTALEIANCDQIEIEDYISPTGDFVKYHKNNGRIKIEWGNKQFTRTLKNDFNCSQPLTGIPSVRWTTSSYIGLGYSCGSPCWGLIILPMNQTDSIFERMYDLAIDTKNNQVVCLDNEKFKQLTVENWKTGKKTEIKIKVSCESAFPGYCIDSVKIQNDELYVRWKELSKGKEDGKVISEFIKIDK